MDLPPGVRNSTWPANCCSTKWHVTVAPLVLTSISWTESIDSGAPRLLDTAGAEAQASVVSAKTTTCASKPLVALAMRPTLTVSPTLRVTRGVDGRGPCVLCKARDRPARRVHALVIRHATGLDSGAAIHDDSSRRTSEPADRTTVADRRSGQVSRADARITCATLPGLP